MKKDDEGFPLLTELQVWKWRALGAEARLAQFELRNLEQSIAAEIGKNPTLVAMIAKKATLASTASDAIGGFGKLRAELEAELGFSLETASIDDETGRVYNLLEGDPDHGPA